MLKEKWIDTFFELFRYCIVGGIAFLVDSGILWLGMNFMPPWPARLYAATSAGFIGGLICNFLLSLIFVFKNAKEKTQGKKVKTFVQFAIIGVIGLGLTELGMHIGVVILGIHYLITKVIVAAIVLMWNYLARKILIFR